MPNFKRPELLGFLFPTVLLISVSTIVSANTAPVVLNTTKALAYPNIDPSLSESLYPNEAATAKQIANSIEMSIRKQYATDLALRDAHPKAHGCVRAEFQINDTLPPTLAQGVFIPGKTYPTWIRFSNASSNAKQADIKKDARGMAIKLLGVSGKNLSDEPSSTQDFIMINHPVFFANDPARYLSFIQDINSDKFLKKLHIPFALGAKGTWIALNTRNKISNPLQTRYWSMVPYQLGLGNQRQAVKYSVRACSTIVSPFPTRPNKDFLREALRTSLQESDACMEFLVQPRTSSAMSVEDSMTEWKEDQAPFYKVATIRIPKQVFDTPEQNIFCENLSFTPWHALAEHKPLGAINRMRKVIYEQISRVRHEMNSTERLEPSSQ
ncbi:catalase family protein [Acinetobacter zhairhuonensis]|uniref:catalase family protein n=1 Tax=Acinetobacter sp. A7.4 TaxID=2919921 RepID=UPI001F4D94DF|nr:catalase family protein [Acinetobacter sp. A7.4]MCJ8160397.1 catalase family protein [Acinetobacter sp. A7.4]